LVAVANLFRADNSNELDKYLECPFVEMPPLLIFETILFMENYKKQWRISETAILSTCRLLDRPAFAISVK
jgi:hypothetical protein